jgi:precorrin-4 methylase
LRKARERQVENMKLPGRVYLVGAGPGDPDLLTVKAARLLAGAEAIVYDRLVSREILAMAGPKALLFPVGKSPKKHPVPQEEINRLLITLAAAGYMTVRLMAAIRSFSAAVRKSFWRSSASVCVATSFPESPRHKVVRRASPCR